MKAFLVGIIVLVLAAAGAYVGLKYFYTPPSGSQMIQTADITKTGILQKSTVVQSDFTHVIISAGKSVGIASYSLDLDQYIGKNVSVTGQFSGTTLFADTVSVIN